ncbi:sugar phosphate isomerase/epimerase family protein [Tepidiforma bonchosmolovskayae]|uniref:Sugar phosphate isomerase/epimerase n=1 Tax=Tepidiforma bonchosmolovskayae TaxID=2601677 RepID=A0ABX6C7C8_9CHLR|nr:sugar phosphate isomerase/epimerase [Tepidiforma bonchosmolovskayae]QFG04120.1 sugar phosphate isomerase/epimerase [Tepidiforma bonchosmolovskayae]
MSQFALSTMFAQQPRFEDGAGFARFAAEAGYDAVEISHSTPAAKVAAIRAARVLPIVSIHQPAPYERLPNGRGNGSLNLAALDEDERRQAVAAAARSIDLAAEVGARRVVVHLGHVGTVSEQFEEELALRRAFDAGERESARVRELREALIARRAATAGPHLAAARRSLQELVALARPRGIAIGIENRYHYHEIPHPDEYAQLLDGFAPEEAGYWHDVGHAEVLHRLGLIDRHAWLDRWSGRCIGAHLHDVEGIGDHRAPGDGDVSWEYVVQGIRHLSSFTLEINQHQPDERVRAARGFLAGVGLG